MLFNSYSFIVFFVPVVYLLFRALSRLEKRTAALLWLTAASFFFYSYWNPPFFFLLLFSVVANYSLGRWITCFPEQSRYLLCLGVVLNLLLIAYFKYGNFFMESLMTLAGGEWTPKNIFLPLGISFFTFQQIAYLIEVARGEIGGSSFLHYALFVSFFPQLIAGPIVRYTDIVPSFLSPVFHEKRYENISMGLFLFSLGLAKKVIVADSLSPWVATAFDGSAVPSFLGAWSGALAYTFQISFDFSGYSDMALGLGKLFNVHIPVNFRSPYKAATITEFWRRWHITLSTFLRDYLYIPLGGNRKGQLRQYANLLITMTLGGLWHGASWTFVLWGGYHGVLLLLHKLFLAAGGERLRVPRWLAWGMTFTLVVIGWVFFRARSLGHALLFLKAMVPTKAALSLFSLKALEALHAPQILLCLLVCLLAPSAVQMASFDAPEEWRGGWWKMGYAAILFVVAVAMIGTKPTEFLYFQF